MVIRVVLLLLLSSMANAAQLTATVDRKELLQDEHVLLTISLINSDTRLRAEGIDPNIDLSRLTGDFDLGTPQAQHRFRIDRSRGRSTSSITLMLFPKHSGELRIPSFTVAGLTTQPIVITAHNSSVDDSPEIFIRSGALKQKLWNREQTLIYLDLYSRIELDNAKLGDNLEITPPQAELRPLPKSTRRQQIHGMDYDVIRSAWLVTPLLSGMLRIDFPDVWIETADGRRRRLPFTQTTIETAALPDSVPPFAIIGKPTLTQKPVSPSLTSGKMFAWEVTLHAPVSVAALPEHLPELSFPPGFKVYHDAVTHRSDNGGSSATYRMLLTPPAAGEFILPTVELPYFDSEHGTMDLVSLPGQTITVSGAAPEPAPVAVIKPRGPENGWKFATLAFASLWLLTLGLLAASLWRRPRHANVDPTVYKPPLRQSSGHSLQNKLLRAMGARTLAQGLLNYEQQYGKDDDIRQTVEALQRLYYAKECDINESELNARVEKTCRKIQSMASAADNERDLWQPRQFTPGING